MTMHHRVGRLALGVALAIALSGCDEAPPGNQTAILSSLEINAFGPSTILPGSQLRITGSNFVEPDYASYTLWLRGLAGTQQVDVLVTAEFVSENELRAPLGDALRDRVALDGPDINGTLRLTRTAVVDGAAVYIEFPARLEFVSQLTAELAAIDRTLAFPGDVVTFSGGPFLLPGEGSVQVVLDGEFVSTSPPQATPLESVTAEAVAVNRNQLTLTLAPPLIGIRPGQLSASVHVRQSALLGETTSSAQPLQIALEFLPPYVESVSPSVVRRGQILSFEGRGLLPDTPLHQSAGVVVLSGFLQKSDGTRIDYESDGALILFPDQVFDNQRMEYVLRVTPDVNGELGGLGVTAGVFRGSAVPWLLYEKDVVFGVGTPVELTI